MAQFKLDKFIKDLNLTLLESSGREYIEISTTEVSRPGLQLAGFFDYFAFNRVQVLGKVEMAFLKTMTKEQREAAFDHFFNFNIPCLIISQDLEATDEMLRMARKHKRVVLQADMLTSKLEHSLINYLGVELAPSITRHGVLIDVDGVGILLIGESGIGKSETALELVKRGHRLVADDAVIIKRVTDNRLVGEAPEVIRHLMEIRGVGIINIEHMYGVSAILKSKSVDLIVQMELWDDSKEYDRFGTEEGWLDILDVRVPRIIVPVRPGRNLAIIMEVTARNARLKSMGYNAFDELMERRSNIYK